jgi:hypothetical protein
MRQPSPLLAALPQAHANLALCAPRRGHRPAVRRKAFKGRAQVGLPIWEIALVGAADTVLPLPIQAGHRVDHSHRAHLDQWDRRGLLRVVAPVGPGGPLAHRTGGPRVDARRMGSEADDQVIVARRHRVEWVAQRARRQ